MQMMQINKVDMHDMLRQKLPANGEDKQKIRKRNNGRLYLMAVIKDRYMLEYPEG